MIVHGLRSGSVGLCLRLRLLRGRVRLVLFLWVMVADVVVEESPQLVQSPSVVLGVSGRGRRVVRARGAGSDSRSGGPSRAGFGGGSGDGRSERQARRDVGSVCRRLRVVQSRKVT